MKRGKALFHAVMVAGILAAVIFLYAYRIKIGRIISPFFLTIPLVYIVKPISEKLASKKLPVGVSIILVYLFFLSVAASVCVFFVPELAANMRELIETLPELMSRFEQMLNTLLHAVRSINISSQLKEAVSWEIEKGISSARNLLAGSMENALNAVVDIARIMVDLTLAMVIAYYIIKDGEKFKVSALLLVPRRWRAALAGTGREINRILAGFIRGQLMTALMVGILETIGLLLIKMKYPLILGMIGGLGNIIPYFGPYIGAIPAVAIALTISPLKAAWTVGVFLAAQQIDNTFISPKMIEGRLGLHPVATIFAVLVGAEFFGIPGMLLSVPAMAILRVIVNRIIEALV